MGNRCCCQAAREPRARLRENLPHTHLRRQGGHTQSGTRRVPDPARREALYPTSSSRSWATCPWASTLYCASATAPSGVTTKVERSTPSKVLPLIVFSPQLPHARATCAPSSERSGNVSCSSAANFSRSASGSAEIPTTVYPAPTSEARLSRKSQASVVHPGVAALG